MKRFKANKSWSGFVEIIGYPSDFMAFLELNLDFIAKSDKYIPLHFRITDNLDNEYGEWINDSDDLISYLENNNGEIGK